MISTELENESYLLLFYNCSFMKELKIKERDKDETIALAKSILSKAHRDAIPVFNHPVYKEPNIIMGTTGICIALEVHITMHVRLFSRAKIKVFYLHRGNKSYKLIWLLFEEWRKCWKSLVWLGYRDVKTH
jgi:hypothetical protein